MALALSIDRAIFAMPLENSSVSLSANPCADSTLAKLEPEWPLLPEPPWEVIRG